MSNQTTFKWTQCHECGRDLGSGGMVSGTYTFGQWSNARQGNYCHSHQIDPGTRRAEAIGGALRVAIGLVLALGVPLMLLYILAVEFIERL